VDALMGIKNKRAQVAVEFLFMFIIAAALIIYIFYFALSLSVLQYRQYLTFMVGRAVSSSSKDYETKRVRAVAVQSVYDMTESSKMDVSKDFVCSLDASDAGKGFRNVLQYWSGDVDKPRYDIFSTAGIACSVEMPYILPNIISGTGGKSLKLAIESMTGSEISNEHCRCLLDFKKTWEDCLSEQVGGQDLAIVDNDC
jgi:hypothetical protein